MYNTFIKLFFQTLQNEEPAIALIRSKLWLERKTTTGCFAEQYYANVIHELLTIACILACEESMLLTANNNNNNIKFYRTHVSYVT